MRLMRIEDVEKLAKELNVKISYIVSAYDGHCLIVDMKPLEKCDKTHIK